jgi:hypothetical protein
MQQLENFQSNYKSQLTEEELEEDQLFEAKDVFNYNDENVNM